MKFTLVLAITALLAAADDLNDRNPQLMGPTLPTRESTLLQGRALETSATVVELGDQAPDFSYQGAEGRWRRLREILAQGPVLLVFGADELTLRVLEHEREHLLDLGVIPVAVTEMRSGAAQALISRHDLRFTVLSDVQGAIASQFNALNPSTGRQLPTWFVLDRKRRVCGLGRRGLPLRGYPTLAANTLGLPVPGAPLPASR
jgi:peroxiredoxin Q/BCP